jgi:hypothetical protein
MNWFVVVFLGVAMLVFLVEAVSARTVVRRVAWVFLVVLIGAWLVFLVVNGYLR